MKIKWTCYMLIFCSVFNICCGTDNKKETTKNSDLAIASVDSLRKDTVQPKESFNEKGLPVNEYLKDRLKPIRENFKRINSIPNWTSIDTQELWESTEGGEAKFYYENQQLEKIVTRTFGETFQQLTEYYLLNNQLSFVFERSCKYNRPMYYDSLAMKENNDTETFDFEKSEIIENRSYFEDEKLLDQINNQDGGSPFAKDYLLKEQKRILAEFEKLG